jgi:hypothetical protein
MAQDQQSGHVVGHRVQCALVVDESGAGLLLHQHGWAVTPARLGGVDHRAVQRDGTDRDGRDEHARHRGTGRAGKR